MFTLDDFGSLISHHLDLDSLSRLAAKLAYHFYLLQHRAIPAFLSDRISRGFTLILDTRSLSGFAWL